MAYRKSDQPIVLRERESRLHGEGVGRIRSRQRKHCPDLDRRNNANLPDGNGKLGKYSDCGSDVSLKSPLLENCTPGSARGDGGQPPFLPRRESASQSAMANCMSPGSVRMATHEADFPISQDCGK
jgi:hypothetical protein